MPFRKPQRTVGISVRNLERSCVSRQSGMLLQRSRHRSGRSWRVADVEPPPEFRQLSFPSTRSSRAVPADSTPQPSPADAAKDRQGRASSGIGQSPLAIPQDAFRLRADSSADRTINETIVSIMKQIRNRIYPKKGTKQGPNHPDRWDNRGRAAIQGPRKMTNDGMGFSPGL